MPITGTIAHPAFNILILLGLLVWVAQMKDLKMLTACIPGLLSLIAVITSPTANNGARYCFPIIYSVPVLLGYCKFRWHQKEIINEQV